MNAVAIRTKPTSSPAGSKELNYNDPKDLVFGFMIAESSSLYLTLHPRILLMLEDGAFDAETYRALKWEVQNPRNLVKDFEIKKRLIDEILTEYSAKDDAWDPTF